MSVIVSISSKRAGDPKKLTPSSKSLDAELYGLGHTLRHLQPPGGNETGIFDAFRLPQEPLTPKKNVNDYFKSHVFDVGKMSSPRPITPPRETTHYHLFAEVAPQTPTARHNNMKSTVFDPDPPKKRLGTLLKRNPITGESCRAIDERSRYRERRVRNPITFEGVKERCVPSRCNQPPGGKCSLVLEYIE